MKSRESLYAIETARCVGMMTATGELSVAPAKSMMAGFAHLGYPGYFANLLSVAKLLGVCALLAPRFARIKEWAYTGFAITIVSALYSHLSSGDGLPSLEQLATFAALAVKLLVLGATGGIGLEIVCKAVARHHSVSVFVRSRDRLAAFQDRIAIAKPRPLQHGALQSPKDRPSVGPSSFKWICP